MSKEFKNLIEVYKNEMDKVNKIQEIFELEQEVYRKIHNLKKKEKIN